MSENIENVQSENAPVQNIQVEAASPAEEMPIVVEELPVAEMPKVEELPEPELPKMEEVKVEPVVIAEPAVSSNTTIIYSLKDLTIPGVGSIKKGYNKVSAQEAAKWLTKSPVRLAKEEEIKTYLK